MPATPPSRILIMAALLLAPAGPARADDEGRGRVEVVRTPDGGIQPQALADARGAVHLVYFQNDPARGDLYYARRNPGQVTFGRPVRVNSTFGSAVAIGTVRGGQMALGREGRVHVAWNGSRESFKEEAPLYYSRLRPAGDGFEPQRGLMKITAGLDGGGTVAADDIGRVYVAWHGRGLTDPAGEDRRRLWVARSEDDGATFGAERPALADPTGACACCGTKALADTNGRLLVLFRAAKENTGRDLLLAASTDGADHFVASRVQPWKVAACPMSTSSLADGPDGPVAAWETSGQVYFARVRAGEAPKSVASPPGRPGGRKHPAVAVSADGSVLLAWAEGTGWQKGGTLAWRLFDPSGRPTDLAGRVDKGIPMWSLPAVVARPDGGFTVIH